MRLRFSALRLLLNYLENNKTREYAVSADTHGLAIERRGAIEIATLNRAAELNTMTMAMIDRLLGYFQGLHDRPEIRVVILRAEGRAFCAGLDLKEWVAGMETRTMADVMIVQRKVARVMKLMRSCPQPVIGLGHGIAAGGGFSLLLATDVRYAAPSLRMNAAYIKIGLGGCDVGSSYFLPRLVGQSVASEFLLTGRFMDAERALRTGLVSEIVAEDKLLETGLALAEDMLATAPMGLRLTKDALNLNIDANGIDAAMAIEDRQQVMMIATEDHKESVAAFIGKRRPAYRDR
jgi:enoyl-CoA hydratase/carnithine racemase